MQIATRKITSCLLINFNKKTRQHIYCFDCKMVLRPFTFNNGAILPRADYGAEIYLEMSNTGVVP